MRHSVVNDDTSTSAQGDGHPDVAAIVSSLANATAEMPSAEGVVLVLPGTGLPCVTGWFHPDASPGLSASVFSIIRDAVTPPLNSANQKMRPGHPPPSTWNRISVGNGRGRIGDLWLYQAHKSPSSSGITSGWNQSSNAISPTLAHIAHWKQDEPDRDALLALHHFSRSLNASVGLQQVCATAVEGFKAYLGATAAEIELFGGNRRLDASARCGQIPIRDGHYEISGKSSADGSHVSTDVEWVFDVFSLISEDGSTLGHLTCYWHEDASSPRISLPLVRLMVEQVSAAVERAELSQRSSLLNWSAASAIADAVDARDSYTRHHARRVAAYCRQIAELLKLPPSDVNLIETAGLLHDIGKIGVPDRVLQASGALEEDDWDLIRRHPELGAAIACRFPDLAPLAPYIRYHHERFDGTGYPSGLSGEEIPLGARIISVVEAFDTLVTGRPYQSPWTVKRTLTTLENLGNLQFDARIVRLFSRSIRNGSIRVEVPPPAKTGDLDLHRWIGAEARAYGLLQRIGNEVGELIDIRRFLERLKQIIKNEFPESMIDIFIRDQVHDHFIAISDEIRPNLDHESIHIIKPDTGVVGWVARYGKSQNLPNVLEDPRYVAPGDVPMRSELAVPMLLDDACVGVINLESPEVSAYSRTDENVLETIASYVARAIQVAELHSQVKQQTDIDSMTGLLNHRAFYRTLEREVDRATRAGTILSVAIVDINDFKLVNDSKGHVWGDVVIRKLADILSRSVRHGDAVARYGGDEFSIIMPGASREIMEYRMEAIEQELAVESAQSPLPGISWGIASFPEDGTRPTELVAQADATMYAIKQQSSH